MPIVKELVLGITGALEFEFYCKLGPTFSERALASHISKIVHAHNHVIDFQCEMPHPSFKTGKKKGRPKSVDVYWRSNNNGKIVDNWLEYKWFGYTDPTLSSLLTDIYRLALLSKGNYGRAFFLAFGMRTSITAFLGDESNKRLVDSPKVIFDGENSSRPKKVLVKDLHDIVRHDGVKQYPRLRTSHLNQSNLTYVQKQIRPNHPQENILLDNPFSTAIASAFPSKCCGFGFEVR